MLDLPNTSQDTENSITPITPNLSDVLWALHDHLGRMEALYKDLRSGHRGSKLLVDVRRSGTGVTTLALGLPGGGSALPYGTLVRVQTLVYWSSVAGTLTVGDQRVIPVAANVTPPTFDGLILYPQDLITLTAGSSANMYLEVAGECILPDDRVSILR